MIKLTIRLRVLAILAAILIVAGILGGYAYLQLQEIRATTAELSADVVPNILYSAEVLDLAVEDFSTVQRYLSTPETDERMRDGLKRMVEKSRIALDDVVRKYSEVAIATGATPVPTAAGTDAAAATEAAPTVSNAAKITASLKNYSQIRDSLIALNEQQGTILELKDRAKIIGNFELLRGVVRETVQQDGEVLKERITATTVQVEDVTKHVFLGSIGAVAFVIVLGFLLLRTVTQPLAHLLGVTRQVSKGDFTQRTQMSRADEFGALAKGFDGMVRELTSLVEQVQRSALDVTASVTEISSTATQQQATATEIAATTTEIGATSKEISATSRDLVNTMNGVSAIAEQTASAAGTGQQGLSRMEETMQLVAEAGGSINAKLAVLNEKAGNINQVVTTITKIADQTNLLSLNAAIEAEKAGEAGRGFAVVATEIRRLADQTAIATFDIEQMVKEIQSAVAAGVMGMDKFSEEVRSGIEDVREVSGQLSRIISQIQSVAPRIVAVTEGMQAQATGAEQISDALVQLTEASQQTAQSLRQSTTAIGGLNQVAASLRGAVSQFKLHQAQPLPQA